jgi:hypothetical protein
VFLALSFSPLTTLQFRLLFGNDPQAPYSESALYNLYAKAFRAVGFESHMKQHLPRHMLAYLQEHQGYEGFVIYLLPR